MNFYIDSFLSIWAQLKSNIFFSLTCFKHFKICCISICWSFWAFLLCNRVPSVEWSLIGLGFSFFMNFRSNNIICISYMFLLALIWPKFCKNPAWPYLNYVDFYLRLKTSNFWFQKWFFAYFYFRCAKVWGKMSLRDQAKQSLPRVLRTSFSQANSLGSLLLLLFTM